jgi:methionyl-tRNA formyltransferase
MPTAPQSIVFCGTSAFAVPSLQALAADPAFRVLCVVTQPDRPAGRKQTLTPPPVKDAAKALGLPVLQPEKLNAALPDLQRAVRDGQPDFLVIVSYGQILSQAILDWPSIAPVNVHASLLPRWRGASPIQHAILAGDRETGVTIQGMVKELDAGPVLAQEKTDMDERETFPFLHDRLADMGAELLVQTLKKPLSPQDQDESEITFCRKLTREDGIADANTETAEDIDRKVRALTPWPGVTMDVEGQTLKILETELQPDADAYPLSCVGGTTLYLLRVQAAGGKPLQGADWARGRHATRKP